MTSERQAASGERVTAASGKWDWRACVPLAILLTAIPAAAQTDPRFVVHVTPEMLRHQHILDTMYFVGFAYELVVLFVILRTGLAAKLRDVSERVVKWRFVQWMLFFVLLSLVTTVAEFPIALYRGFVVPHEFALTHQTFAAWMGDLAKGLGVDLAIGSVIVALVLLAMRRVRQWWLVLWAGSLPLVVLGVIATPPIIDPPFNDFRPLRDPVPKRDLIPEASRAGIG